MFNHDFSNFSDLNNQNQKIMSYNVVKKMT